VRAIVGHDVQEASAAVSAAPRGRPVLEVRGVSDEQLLRDVSLTVHAGEVVGLAGLVGAGRTELARIVYADTRATSGEILLNGRRVHWREPADAVAAGVGYVPEERRSEALFLDRSIEFNLNIADLDTLRLARRLPLLHPRRSRSRAQQVSGRLTVNVSDMQVPLGSLSGGNQQKVVIGRWLAREPVLLILDEPSRGVDVGARAEIHHIVRELAARGTAVLAISSDPEEMPTLCDRVLVMAEGRVRAELSGADITANRIVSLSFSAANRADTAAKSAERKEAP
jgi:ABC-type sugar transport system ATPase subunit